jgi:hypothetical protein
MAQKSVKTVPRLSLLFQYFCNEAQTFLKALDSACSSVSDSVFPRGKNYFPIDEFLRNFDLGIFLKSVQKIEFQLISDTLT